MATVDDQYNQDQDLARLLPMIYGGAVTPAPNPFAPAQPTPTPASSAAPFQPQNSAFQKMQADEANRPVEGPISTKHRLLGLLLAGAAGGSQYANREPGAATNLGAQVADKFVHGPYEHALNSYQLGITHDKEALANEQAQNAFGLQMSEEGRRARAETANEEKPLTSRQVQLNDQGQLYNVSRDPITGEQVPHFLSNPTTGAPMQAPPSTAMVPAGGTLVNKGTGASMYKSPSAAKAPPRAVAGTIDNKPAWGEQTPQGWIDPQTQQSIPGFKPAPNYAQVAPGLTAQRQETQTKTLFGPDGKPHDYGYNPQTQRFDRDMGFSTSGQIGSREGQANIVQNAGGNLIQDIQAHKGRLGTLSAWYGQHTLSVPYVGDPELAELDAELRSFAALNPAMHGFRSTNALDTFEKIVGGLAKNPDATIASIRGILKTAGVMGTGGGAGGGSPQQANPAGGGAVYRAINPRTGQVHEGNTPPPPGWQIVSSPNGR